MPSGPLRTARTLKPPLGTLLAREGRLAAGLVDFWPMGEGGGALLDEALGRNPGTITSPGWAAGPRGMALSLDGTNTFVTCGNPRLASTGGAFALWVYAGFDTTGTTAFYALDATNGTRYILYKNSLGASAWGVYLNNVAVFDTSSSLSGLIPTQQWTHIAVSWTPSTQSIYRNGVLFTTNVTSLGTLASPATLYIGQRFSAVSRWQGSLELLALWARPLFAAEVQQLYAEPLCLFAAPRRVWVMPRVQGPTLAAASLAPSGAITRTPSHQAAGRSTCVGAIVRTPSHAAAGSSTPAGALLRTPAHVLAGASTPAGALARTPLGHLAGALSPGAGDLARTITGTGAAALAASGALGPAISTAYDATLGATGDLVRTASTALEGATLAAAGALGRVAQVTRGATLDLGGAFGRAAGLGRGASVTLAGALARTPRRPLAGALAPGGALARTAALVRAGAVPLRGRFVGITGVVRRAALALVARVSVLLAPPRAGSQGQSTALRLGPRAHTLVSAAPARPARLALPPRARTLHPGTERTVPMQLVADDPDAPLDIAPLERNLEFVADLSARIPTGRQIASVATQVVRLDDPTATDLSEDFVATTTRTSGNTGVAVIVGNGAQQERATYRVRIIATLDNSPATDLVGYFDLPCRE